MAASPRTCCGGRPAGLLSLRGTSSKRATATGAVRRPPALAAPACAPRWPLRRAALAAPASPTAVARRAALALAAPAPAALAAPAPAAAEGAGRQALACVRAAAGRARGIDSQKIARSVGNLLFLLLLLLLLLVLFLPLPLFLILS